MTENSKYPSLFEQGKNLAKFSLDLIKHIHSDPDKFITVSDEVYKERISICKTCDKYDELENRCTDCGCYLPAKARVILDSCPLDKWGSDENSWENKFDEIVKDMNENNSET